MPPILEDLPDTLPPIQPANGLPGRIYKSDWLSRVTIPDMYPRREDPYVPPIMSPQVIPPASIGSSQTPGPQAGIFDQLTQPGSRPYSYQRAVNFSLTVGTTFVPLMNQRFECDTILINVPSSALQSVFFGWGSAISTTSGEEIRPGNPQAFSPDNVREYWELQRPLEMIATMMATQMGAPTTSPYRTSRIVFNANEYGLISTANTVVAVMLFYIVDSI